MERHLSALVLLLWLVMLLVVGVWDEGWVGGGGVGGGGGAGYIMADKPAAASDFGMA
jgi:hypothetical protein